MADSKTICTCDVAPGNKPHHHRSLQPKPPILDNILQHVGNTPLVRLKNISRAEGLQCELLGKCEYFNASGSVKDRVVTRIIDEAEASGRLRPGCTVIEPTSGNAGIALATACAIRGYKCIVTMPEKMSQDKVVVLRALGAQIIRTPTEAAWNSPESYMGVAHMLCREIPHSVILGQHTSPYNTVSHYDSTAEELILACNGKIDMLVAGTGTGGTLTGIARKVKELSPECIVVGVDPVGSILAQPEYLNEPSLGRYFIEGIGQDFIPETLDRSLVDVWLKVADSNSIYMARRLIREEGILCGGSSGSAVLAAVEAARGLGPDKRCVVILPDTIRNYMSQLLKDGWIRKCGFIDEASEKRREGERRAQWDGARVRDLKLKRAVVIEMGTPAVNAVELMNTYGFDQLPVISSSGFLRGIVTLGNVLSRIMSGSVTVDAKVADVMFRFSTKSKKFHEITPDTPLVELDRFFESDIAVIVTERLSDDGDRVAFIPIHVVTAVDLLTFLMSRSKQKGA